MDLEFTDKEATRIADALGTYGVDKIKESIKSNGKIGTGKTHESVRYDFQIGATFIDVRFYALDGILWIIRGRRPGGKLPVQKVGDEFKLFPDLAEWRDAVIPQAEDFPLAKHIAVKGITPTPDLLEKPFELIRNNFNELIIALVQEEFAKQLGFRINEIFSRSVK